MTTSKIEIVITTKGQRQVIRGMNAIGQASTRAGNQTTKATGRMSRGLSSAALRARSVSRYFQKMEGTIRRTSASIMPFTARLRAMNGALVIPPGGLNSMRQAGRSLRGLLGIFASFYTARIGVELSDSFTRIGNTLKGFGAAERDLGRLRKRITEISLAARVSSEETATLFGRFSLATKGLGLTEEDVLDVTETVNKALRLSGSSSLEASQSVRQLSQAFNKGKLDGDEFRSVMENAPVIVKLLSKEVGVGKTALFDMARQGKISTAVLVKALRKGKVDIDKLFGKLDITFGDALQNLKTKAVDFIGSINSQTGAGAAMIKFLEIVGDNLKGILQTLIAIAAVRVGSSVINSLAPFQTAAQSRFAASSAQRTQQRIATIRAQGAPGSLSTSALAASNAALAAGTVKVASKKATGQATLLVAPFQKLFGLLKKLVTGPLRAMVTLFRTLISVARFLTGPIGLVVTGITLIAAGIGSGFLSRLQAVTGETSKWSAVVTALSRTWRTLVRVIQASMATLFSPAAAFFEEWVVLGLDVGLTNLVAGMGAAGLVIMKIFYDIEVAVGKFFLGMFESAKQFIADTIRELATLVEMLNDLPFMKNDLNKKLGIELPGAGEIRKFANAIAPVQEKKKEPEVTERQRAADFKKYGTSSPGDLAVLKLIDGYKTLFNFTMEQNQKELKAGGGFGGLDIVTSALGDFGKVGADIFRQYLSETTLRDEYGASFTDLAAAADSLAGLVEKNQALINSELAEGELGLSATDFQEIFKKLTELKRRFDPEQIGPTALSTGEGSETESLRKSKVAADRITEYLASARSALEEFSSVADKAGTSKEELEQAVSRLQGEFKTAAEKLPPEFRQAGIDGANALVTEAKTILDAGFGKIGASAKAAFLTGLGGSLGALLETVKTGNPRGGDDSVGTLPPTDFARDDQRDAISSLRAEVKTLTDANTALGASYDAMTAKANKFADAGASQFKRLNQGAKTNANEIQNFFESAFGSLEDALVSFVTTGEFDFKKLMNAILADLARLIVRMLIIKPLMSMLGGFFGFAQGGRVPAFASGGKIPKYATGGGMIGGYGGSTSDRYAAMVSPGEAVIRSSQVRRNRGIVGELLGGKKVKKKTAGGGGAVAVTYAPVINVTGGSDDGGEQQGQEIQAVIEKGFMEMLTREMRPNGALEGASRRSFS